ncbi:MAG TPA: hypothetical protein DCO86_00860 [Spirochaetaceae bacterium]|nr:hypothetical protein [Spirochaetaceae bacterium]
MYLSRGNLYHSGSSASSGWNLEELQYDYRIRSGNASVLRSQASAAASENVGLLYWSATSTDDSSATDMCYENGAFSVYRDSGNPFWGRAIRLVKHI